MPEITIRRTEPKDFKTVQEIQITGGKALETNGDVIEFYEMEMQTKSNNGLFGVAESDGKVIGFIYGEKLVARWALCSYFVVHPDFRGTDAFHKLGEWFIENAKKLGAKYIWILAESENIKLVDFYERFGFKKGGNYTEMVKEI